MVTQESFREDVANHKMKVLLNQGNYRHLLFQAPQTSNQYFEIVTFPGTLVYVGDMGSFVFQRIEDMFQFFRTRSQTNLDINPSYWGEKLESVDRDGRNSGHKIFSPSVFRSRVEETVAEWIVEFQGPYDADESEIDTARKEFEDGLRNAVEEDIDSEDGEQEAHRSLSEFMFEFGGVKYEFHDTWEWDCRDYTGRFLWCCYALAWGIQQYDKSKENHAAA